jgi:hypothetical protein
MRRLAVLLLAIIGVVAGCTSGSDNSGPSSGGSVARTVDSGSPSTAVAVADPCDGAGAGCAQVAEADVDGDGAVDRVGIIVDRPTAAITVRAAAASGVSEIRLGIDGQQPSGGSPAGVFVGAYRISRTSGADVVLHTQVGQGNADQFAVIGFGGGNLVRVPRPPALSANYPDPDVWYIGTSHGVHEWVTCDQGASVTMSILSAPTAEGIPLPGGGIRESNHFAFNSGTWTPTGSENVADANFSYDFDPHTQTFQCEDQRR